MSRAVVKLPRAEGDLIGCYAYLSEQASDATADRFLAPASRDGRAGSRAGGGLVFRSGNDEVGR
jgi:hypothetical protein